MRIGVFNNGWWKPACDAMRFESVTLPVADGEGGNAYSADLPARTRTATAAQSLLAGPSLDLLIDNGGTGLGFVPATDGPADLQVAHETAGKPLYSHFIDPINTAMQGLAWPVVWQCLQSRTWVKAIWDRAHALELQRFGVPNVIHLPMAAPDRAYNTDPLDSRRCLPIISFVGGQNTSYFAANSSVATGTLLAGALTQSIQADLPNVSFHDAYFDLYGLGEPLLPNDTTEAATAKTATYLNAKLFYNAGLCIRQRDRFVIFLKRKLGESFRLIGTRWDQTYGLAAEPPFPTAEAYFNHFREAAINLNFVNGNAETGLNMRHFEITAAGGFMLCYQQPELEQCFQIGKECAVFQNETDLLDKIRFYLSHPDERTAIALAGQRRTLSEHLYSHRLVRLLQIAPPTPRTLPVEYSQSTWRDDFRAVLPHPDVVLDCGANIGQMATGLRELYPQATIYSFEPVSAVFSQLERRCSDLNVHPVRKAVGDRCGRTRINLTASPEANSLLGFQEGNPCAQWTHVVGEEEIEVCTLDRWCAEARIDPSRVDIIKLDVQGAELKALYGARNLLKTAKLIYLEVSFVPIYKDCPLLVDIEAFLNESGYRRRAIYPSDQPHNWADALFVKV